MKEINTKLNTLGKKRSNVLSFLRDTDVFNKYKTVADELINLSADVKSLERQKDSLQRLQILRTEIRNIKDEKLKLQTIIETNVEKQNSNSESHFSHIRILFSEIIEEVLNRKALLSVSPNSVGHLEFNSEILDESGNTTSADMGHTYRKLLCVAFDMALVRANLNKNFPRFIFHDGIFESLDDRKKQNLLSIIRDYNQFGIQHIVTMINSDLPNSPEGLELFTFREGEVPVTLHDEGEEGRLFKMNSW